MKKFMPRNSGTGVKPRKKRRILKGVQALAVCACALLLAAGGTAAYLNQLLPDQYLVTKGSELRLPEYMTSESCSFSAPGAGPAPEAGPLSAPSLTSSVAPLEERMTLKLFGILPIKEVAVRSVEEQVVVPCGTPFGIKLLTDGVMVVGLGQCEAGGAPALEAGIQTGDVVISMNGKKVSSKADVVKEINVSGGMPIPMKVSHGGEVREVTLTPVFSPQSGSYQAGMWVRDSTAGIGTVTFYDPETGMFGGLGHPVCDVDTGELLPLSSGEAAAVNISGVHRGSSGTPGELLGNFISPLSIGTLFENCACGLFGRMNNPPSLASAVPVAMRQDIQPGDATILSTISGQTPKEYRVRIERVDWKDSSSYKNMVIQITDPELLSAAGGIVQGMSGSPILQNGKLVGAVTHVFVNDPTKGYGIFADTMLREAAGLEAARQENPAA